MHLCGDFSFHVIRSYVIVPLYICMFSQLHGKISHVSKLFKPTYQPFVITFFQVWVKQILTYMHFQLHTFLWPQAETVNFDDFQQRVDSFNVDIFSVTFELLPVCENINV